MFKIKTETSRFIVNGEETLELNCHGENDREGSFVAIALYGDKAHETVIKAVAERRQMLSENPTKFRIIMPTHLSNPITVELKHRKLENDKWGDIFKVTCYAKEIIFE